MLCATGPHFAWALPFYHFLISMEAMFLANYGFTYNPFAIWESSDDPHLARHIVVGNDAYSIAWEDKGAALFAPAGGGKSALRLYTAHSSWQLTGFHRPFPVTCLLTPSAFRTPLAREAITSLLVNQMASSLLVDCLLHPEGFLDLSLSRKRQVAAYLRAYLPFSLEFGRERVEQAAGLTSLLAVLDASARLVERAPLEMVHDALDQLLALSAPRLPSTPTLAQLHDFTHLLLDDLGYRSLYLLLDGIDGTAESSHAVGAAYPWLEAILEHLASLPTLNAWLKGFFPQETMAHLAPLLGTDRAAMRIIEIRWTAPALAEMLKRRVWCATEGMSNSLTAFSTPELRDVERILVTQPEVEPLPREVLAFTQSVLDAFESRVRSTAGRDQLSRQDIEAGRDRYLATKPQNSVPYF